MVPIEQWGAADSGVWLPGDQVIEKVVRASHGRGFGDACVCTYFSAPTSKNLNMACVGLVTVGYC
jgi:hypothetical protein